MLEIKYFRESLEDVEDSEKKRGKPISHARNTFLYDRKWRNALKEVEGLRAKRNELNKEVARLRSQGKKAEPQIREMRKISSQIDDVQKKSDGFLKQRDEFRKRVGNLLDKKVPKGRDEKDNVELKKVGKKTKFRFKHKDHIELGLDLDLFDFEKGSGVAGSRFVYLKNEGVVLDWALQMHAIETLVKNRFKMIWPPLMLNKKTTGNAVNLSEFEDTIYKIENEDLYLIGSSEIPIVNLHQNETLDKKDLPILYGGISPCFRKEAGTHGKDDKGIFRMHQFNKAEQVAICKQEDAEKYFAKLQKITEKFFSDIKIPFRVVNICSGDLGEKQSLQYDIEAWFPGQNNKKGSYREVTSCSNCRSYQAVNAKTRYLDDGEKKYVYMLNNTMVATSRALAALLENHQQKDGSVKIPGCLWKYTGFRKIKAKK